MGRVQLLLCFQMPALDDTGVSVCSPPPIYNLGSVGCLLAFESEKEGFANPEGGGCMTSHCCDVEEETELTNFTCPTQ